MTLCKPLQRVKAIKTISKGASSVQSTAPRYCDSQIVKSCTSQPRSRSSQSFQHENVYHYNRMWSRQMSSDMTTRSMAKQTVKTRLLIISDTHGAPLQEAGHGRTPAPPFTAPLPSADVLIHCGDLTSTGTLEQYHRAMDMMRQIAAPVKLVIAGNHDRTLDRTWVMAHADKYNMTQDEASQLHRDARDLWTAPDGRAVTEGITFLDEGTHRIELQNGALLTVYATPYTPAFFDWGFPYERHEDRFNPAAMSLTDATSIATSPVSSYSDKPSPVDVLITHGPPWGRRDQTYRQENVGCLHTLRALMRARPAVHCFGHIHEAWGAERVRWKDAAVVDQVIQESCTMERWEKGKWKEGKRYITKVAVDEQAVRDRHVAYVDVSDSSEQPLRRGEETLLINASIMTLRYKPLQAPWMVDLELPRLLEDLTVAEG